MAAESLGESAIEGDSVVFVSVSAVAASSLPHAAVMPRAETAATVAAYFLMERIALSLRHSGRIPLSARAFVSLAAADWYFRQFLHATVTLTLSQPVEPSGATGARVDVWV